MNKSKDIPIYVLSASLVFFGIATASQANSAPTSAPTLKQFQQLQKSVSTLKNDLGAWSNAVEILQKEIEPLIQGNDSDNDSVSLKLNAIDARLKSLEAFKRCGSSNFTKLWIWSSGMVRNLETTSSCV